MDQKAATQRFVLKTNSITPHTDANSETDLRAVVLILQGAPIVHFNIQMLLPGVSMNLLGVYNFFLNKN